MEDCYKFIVVPGNNSGLIRKALERRDWWIEIPPVHSMYNFKWQPVSAGIKFERLGPVRPKPGELGSTGPSSAMAGVSGGQLSNQDNSSSIDAYAEIGGVGVKQMVNHLEFHYHISEKAALFNEMQKHCDGMKENVFDLCVPITFYVEVLDIEKPQAYN